MQSPIAQEKNKIGKPQAQIVQLFQKFNEAKVQIAQKLKKIDKAQSANWVTSLNQ